MTEQEAKNLKFFLWEIKKRPQNILEILKRLQTYVQTLIDRYEDSSQKP